MDHRHGSRVQSEEFASQNPLVFPRSGRVVPVGLDLVAERKSIQSSPVAESDAYAKHLTVIRHAAIVSRGKCSEPIGEQRALFYGAR